MLRKPRHKVSGSPPGVEITPEVSLKVDWSSLVSNLVTVAAQGFATCYGITDGTSNAISALAAAAASVKSDTPVGQRAWSLFCLSFAWAFDELRELGILADSDSVSSVRKALAEAKNIINDSPQLVPISFLRTPTSLPLYTIIRDQFIKFKSSYRPHGGEPDSVLQARFDAAFSRAVYEIWSRNPEIFQPIEAALSAPGALASAFEVQWQAYRKALIHDFEVKPIFGQEQNRISVSQLYVPLRAVWREDPKERDARIVGGDGVRTRSIAHVVKLDDELDDWVFSAPTDDCIRLIGGSPGSGKSTTVRALARRVADREDRRPLYIPLQHIDIGRDLREAINSFFVDRTRGTFRQPPLSRESVEHAPPLVLIFDGLDELARPGVGANEVAQLFVTKLNQLISSLIGEGLPCVKVVVTGRMPSFDAAKIYTSATNRRSYEVAGFLPAAHWTTHSAPDTIEQELMKVDQRPIWWSKYAAAVGESNEIPRAMIDTRLRGITHEPLLCYLLALSGYAVDNWEEAAENRNRIYERLIDEIWKRGWGDGGRQGSGKNLSRDHFNRLMETFALAAWRGGDTKVATEARFLETLSIMRAEEAWDQFKEDGGADITNLAMNFYLKSPETERRGFEFTHKSFGEYLTGRALLTIARSVLDLGSRRLEAAAQEWLRATATGVLTHDSVQFIRDEVRLLVSRGDFAACLSLKNYFMELATFAIDEGLPAQGNISQKWRSAVGFQNSAELAVWTVLNSCALAIGAREPSSARVHIDWKSSHALAELLDRLGRKWSSRAQLHREESPADLREEGLGPTNAFSVRDCLAYIEADNADLFEAYLDDADLRHANLRGASLSGAHLCGAKVSGANFEKATLVRAHLDNVDFRDSVIKSADFHDARLCRAKFTKKQMERAPFSTVTLVDPLITLDLHTVTIGNPRQPLGAKQLERLQLLYSLASADKKAKPKSRAEKRAPSEQ
jgi:uncharacterized protein YjbI with pentapeptide repeats